MSNVMVAADYSQIEPRIAAYYGDLWLRNRGRTLHAARAAQREQMYAQHGDLLEEREFLTEYNPPPETIYPEMERSNLTAQYLPGGVGDVYVDTAQGVFDECRNMSAAEVRVRKDPVSGISYRNRAKPLLLGILFCKGPKALSHDLKVPVSVAAEYLEQLEERYPAVIGARTEAQEFIRATGIVETITGGKRRIPGIYHALTEDHVRLRYRFGSKYYMCEVIPLQRWRWVLHCYIHRIYEEDSPHVLHFDSVTDYRRPGSLLASDAGRQVALPFKNFSYKAIRRVYLQDYDIEMMPIEDANRVGWNYQIQSSACSIFKMALVKIHHLARRYGAKLLLPVHDEVVLEVPRRKLGRFARKLRKIMEARPPLPHFQVPLKVDIQWGCDYGDLHPLKWWH